MINCLLKKSCVLPQESFSVAKSAFRQFKMKVRANLSITHIGPETLEEAVQDYVNRNCDLYDLPGMVSVSNMCLCLYYRKRSLL